MVNIGVLCTLFAYNNSFHNSNSVTAVKRVNTIKLIWCLADKRYVLYGFVYCITHVSYIFYGKTWMINYYIFYESCTITLMIYFISQCQGQKQQIITLYNI